MSERTPERRPKVDHLFVRRTEGGAMLPIAVVVLGAGAWAGLHVLGLA